MDDIDKKWLAGSEATSRVHCIVTLCNPFSWVRHWWLKQSCCRPHGPISRDVMICSNTPCRGIETPNPSPPLLTTADLLLAPLANIMLFSHLNTGTIASSPETIARLTNGIARNTKTLHGRRNRRASLQSQVFAGYLFDKGLGSRVYKKLKRWQNPPHHLINKLTGR